MTRTRRHIFVLPKYTPAHPRIVPVCGNCRKHCSDEIERCITIKSCTDWEPKHPFFFTVIARLDSVEELSRFRIINVLDKLDRWCWADLVLWAERSKPFHKVGPIKGCIPENYPYCGKCEKFLPPEGRLENVENPVWSSERGMWISSELAMWINGEAPELI